MSRLFADLYNVNHGDAITEHSWHFDISDNSHNLLLNIDHFKISGLFSAAFLLLFPHTYMGLFYSKWQGLPKEL